MIHRFLRRFVLMNLAEGADAGGGGGGVVDTPVDTSAAPSAPAADTSAAPGSMLEALNRHFETQPRDERGRFAPTAAEQAAAAAAAAPGGDPAAAPPQPGAQAAAQPGQPGTQPAQEQPQKPAAEDLTQMPEGLAPKAQERFQRLATTNRELTGQVEQLTGQVGYVREAFQAHGVQQPQFEQAMQVIGLMNRGDLQGALAALDEQRRHISLALGQPLPGVDALAGHADLRQAVDQGQLDEQYAIEIARNRQGQQAQQQRHQQAEQQHAAQRTEQQAVQSGTQAVDAFCRDMAAKDLDYPAIEAKLLPELSNLLQGVPPQRWRGLVETQYRLLKQVATSSRSAAPQAPAGQVLRPTGQPSPGAAPKTMHEAMWGGR